MKKITTKVILLSIIFFIGLISKSHSQCIKGNCYNGNGTFLYPNGDKYQGQWKVGQMQGMGKYEYSNGDRYEGQFHFNKKDGTGIYVWKNKGSYIGQWKNDMREGSGKFQWPNSSTYNGFWKQDKIINTDVNVVTDTQKKPTFEN